MTKSIAGLYTMALKTFSVTWMAGVVIFMAALFRLFDMSDDMTASVLLICGFTGAIIFLMTMVSHEKSWPEKPSVVQMGFSLMTFGSSVIAISVLSAVYSILQAPKFIPFFGFIFLLLGFIVCIWATWAKPKNPAR